MFCCLYWQRLSPFWGMPHFLHLLNEESFLNQISLSLFSLLVTSLTPLQLVCLRMNCQSKLRRSERSIRYEGRCLAVRLQASCHKRGSDTPSRSYPQRSDRKSTFLGYTEVVEVTFARPATRSRTISSNNQHQTTEGQSVNKVNVHSVPLL